MIPKKIHYCWFGGNPLPEDAIRCINSWKKFFPDYEIVEWNENNFDVNICMYVREAYEAKKWAFVSDYARFWILYNYGGLYFDTDVEVIKDFGNIIELGNFMGTEPYRDGRCRIAAGLGLGAEKELEIYKEILEYYEDLKFYISDGVYNDETVVTYITSIFEKYGYKGDCTIEKIKDVIVYPPEYFCPMSAENGVLSITDNTRSIHWYSASWKDEYEIKIHNVTLNIYKKMPNIMGKKIGLIYENCAKSIYYLRKEGLTSVMRRIIRKISKSLLLNK